MSEQLTPAELAERKTPRSQAKLRVHMQLVMADAILAGRSGDIMRVLEAMNATVHLNRHAEQLQRVNRWTVRRTRRYLARYIVPQAGRIADRVVAEYLAESIHPEADA